MKTDFVDTTLSSKAIAKNFPLLSRREIEVCYLVGRRLSTSEIALCLSINNRTVEKHLEGIFKKLQVRSREQLRGRLGIQMFLGDWRSSGKRN